MHQQYLGRLRRAGATPHARVRVVAPALPSSRSHGQLKATLAAGSLCGLLLLATPANAAPALQAFPLVLGDSNSAILSDLRRLSKTEQRFGVRDPLQATQALSKRFQASQQQLQRIELLVKIQQYDSARLQLRDGSVKTLRMDLAYGQEMYRVVSETAVRQVVDGIQQLDAQLKREEPVEAIKPTLQQLQERLGNLADLVASLEQ